MNTNVGDMPLDVFSDYIQDSQGYEFPWEFLQFTLNGNEQLNEDDKGNGYRYQAFPFHYIGRGNGYWLEFCGSINVEYGNGHTSEYHGCGVNLDNEVADSINEDDQY